MFVKYNWMSLFIRQRTCQDYGHRPSLTAPPWYNLEDTDEISRFSSIEYPRMRKFLDSAGPLGG